MTALLAARDAGLIEAYIYQTAARHQAAETYGIGVEDTEVLRDDPGYGIHVHDDACEPRRTWWPGCMKDADNSDRIVTIGYTLRSGHRWEAVYGVLDGDVQLWMD